MSNILIRDHVDIRRRLRDGLLVARGDADRFLFLDQLEFWDDSLLGLSGQFFRVSQEGCLSDNHHCQHGDHERFLRACELRPQCGIWNEEFGMRNVELVCVPQSFISNSAFLIPQSFPVFPVSTM
ncbi:MAG: hypothetical protein JW384_01328 [Nitrosomonadaceae bacterium]|nr:hypothetical protein [Nitrosomonadaceae bacterium]